MVESNEHVIIDFSAEWCAPCKIVGPILDQIDEENPDISVFKVDIDDDPTGLTSEFAVRNIPTLLYFKGGQVIDRTAGSLPKTMILSKFNK